MAAAGVRGLARARDAKVRADTVDTVLAAEVGGDIEVLASMTGHAWEVLDDDARRARFCERLAASAAGQAGFDALTAVRGRFESLLARRRPGR